MKKFALDITTVAKAQRPIPAAEILWGSQDGGQNRFPTSRAAWERKNAPEPLPLQKFARAVADAQDRVWLVDQYLLIPDKDKGTPADRVDQILTWLPLQLAASDIRLLTKEHKGIGEDERQKFQRRAQEISNYHVRRGRECRIELKMHLRQDNCDFLHDRFAIVDDELWHFGATVGGFHADVSAASRGWRASDHGAIDFFEEIWNAGGNK